jgi:hypothetical protein
MGVHVHGEEFKSGSSTTLQISSMTTTSRILTSLVLPNYTADRCTQMQAQEALGYTNKKIDMKNIIVVL